MLLDEVDITIKAGHGGAGKSSFATYGPDGGDGGKGGNVYIAVTSDLKALNQFSSVQSIEASDGTPGSNRNSDGKKGADVTVTLPIGTTLTDLDTNDSIELINTEQNFLICRGGLGGRGNLSYKSSKNRSPSYSQPGLPGETKKFHVVLRFIADYGLVGLPNAGKSSLLNELTNAKAAVGAYPFTTLEANLGVLGHKIIADIPGLIEGASSGRGLGTRFLKHIEKVKMLLHCISAESSNVTADFNTVSIELEKYNPELINKQRLILLTKTDLVTPQVIKDAIKKLSPFGCPIYPVSIHDLESIERLHKVL